MVLKHTNTHAHTRSAYSNENENKPSETLEQNKNTHHLTIAGHLEF